MRRTDSNTVKMSQSKHSVGKVSLGLVCAGAAVISMVAAYGFLQVRPEVVSQNANTQIKPLASLADSKAEKSSDELREDAMQAYQAGQLFAPAGNNAIELYLRALSQNPNDFGSKEAVFELIPAATLALETAINAGNSVEIERLSGLLLQADPSSTRIGALALRGRAQIAAGIAAAELASTALPEPRVTVDAPVAAAVRSPEAVETVIASAAPSEAVANEPRVLPAASPVAVTPVIASAPAPVLASLSPSASLQAPVARAARGEVVDARVIKSSPPMFPVEAKRRKSTGWVDLKLQVDASGKVTDAVVVESMPGRIFDAEAKRAVMRWRFSPKTVDSKAVASTVNQRITFKPEI
jgi:periplasmic protein TonB